MIYVNKQNKESWRARVILQYYKMSSSLGIGLSSVLIIALHNPGQKTSISESILSHPQTPGEELNKITPIQASRLY